MNTSLVCLLNIHFPASVFEDHIISTCNLYIFFLQLQCNTVCVSSKYLNELYYVLAYCFLCRTSLCKRQQYATLILPAGGIVKLLLHH